MFKYKIYMKNNCAGVWKFRSNVLLSFCTVTLRPEHSPIIMQTRLFPSRCPVCVAAPPACCADAAPVVITQPSHVSSILSSCCWVWASLLSCSCLAWRAS